jgi:hypothetical protein
VNVHRAESLIIFVGLVNSVDAVNNSNAQLPECSENGALGLFSADCRKGARDTDAGGCNGSCGFAIHGAGNISTIYTLKGFVVGIAGSAVITGVFTRAVITRAVITAAVITRAVITGDVTLATTVFTAVVAIAGDVTLATTVITTVITAVVATGIGSLVVG